MFYNCLPNLNSCVCMHGLSKHTFSNLIKFCRLFTINFIWFPTEPIHNIKLEVSKVIKLEISFFFLFKILKINFYATRNKQDIENNY